jgi:parallel beta-helix repeat protein
MRTVLITLIVLASSAPPVLARTWRVYEDGSGHAPTVQAAIDSAGDGDAVLVGPGTYYETLNLLGKAIELRSSAGPEATILDGSLGDNSVIVCDSGETQITVISGFTVTGGSGYPITPFSRTGGGIVCLDSCPTIQNNIIIGNRSIGLTVDSRGGGISFGGPNQCKIVIRDNIIQNNTAESNGGGINIGGPCIIEKNTFIQNKTLTGDGGGVYDLTAEHDVHIISNLFLENEAGDHGGGIYIGRANGPASEVEISGNIMIGNSTLSVGGLSDCSGGAIRLGSAGAVVVRNTLAFNHGEAGPEAGGGICLNRTHSDVLIERNILFHNSGGIRTHAVTRGTVRRNLIFGNGLSDIKLLDGADLLLEENLFTDPLFCVWGPESRGELSWISPALNSPYGVIGTVEEGSCGPEVRCLDCTAVRSITWGRLKTLYR